MIEQGTVTFDTSHRLSDAICAVSYLPSVRILAVEFHSGRKYAYMGVPIQTVMALLVAESRGRFYNLQIKGRYEVQRLPA